MKRTLVFVLIVSMILLVSCGGSSEGGRFGSGDKVKGDEEWLTGTKGLDMKLADSSTLTVPAEQNEAAQFDVILENLGREEIDVTLMLSGFDSNYISFDKPATTKLTGKSRYGPGQLQYVTVNSNKVTLSFSSQGAGAAGIRRLEQPVTVNACYTEKTRVQVPICVDLDPLRDGSCPTENTISVPKGQGAPVGLSSLTYKSYRMDEKNIRLNLDFTFQQFDKSNDAKVFDKDFTGLCTATASSPEMLQKENDVYFQFTSDFGKNMDCPGLTDKDSGGTFDIVRRPTIRCFVNVLVTGDSLNSVLDFMLEYKMWQKVTQPIVIEKY